MINQYLYDFDNMISKNNIYNTFGFIVYHYSIFMQMLYCESICGINKEHSWQVAMLLLWIPLFIIIEQGSVSKYTRAEKYDITGEKS